jgi:hypothetical protein
MAADESGSAGDESGAHEKYPKLGRASGSSRVRCQSRSRMIGGGREASPRGAAGSERPSGSVPNHGRPTPRGVGLGRRPRLEIAKEFLLDRARHGLLGLIAAIRVQRLLTPRLQASYT